MKVLLPLLFSVVVLSYECYVTSSSLQNSKWKTSKLTRENTCQTDLGCVTTDIQTTGKSPRPAVSHWVWEAYLFVHLKSMASQFLESKLFTAASLMNQWRKLEMGVYHSQVLMGAASYMDSLNATHFAVLTFATALIQVRPRLLTWFSWF